MALLVRVGGEVDRALAQRVEGQLVDLPVHCQVLETGPASQDLSVAVRESRELAERHGARVVVWFEAEPEVTAYVAEPGARRLLVRTLGPLQPESQRSAQLEAAALVVRTAVRALASGGEMGTDEQQLVPPRPPPATPEPAASEPAPAPPPAAPKPGLPRWHVGLGAQAGMDGASPRGSYAVRAELGWRRKRLELGLRGSGGIPVALEEPDAHVQFSRSSVEATLGIVVWSRHSLALLTNLSAGVALYRTRVQARIDGFDPSSLQRTLLPLVSAELMLRHFPRPASGLGWGLVVGVDGLPRRPELVVNDGDQQSVREVLYRFAPRVGLALWWRR